MLLDQRVDAFAANRTRMEELVRDVPGLRVLPDDYMVTLQAIVCGSSQTPSGTNISRPEFANRSAGVMSALLQASAGERSATSRPFADDSPALGGE